ncbi:MAG: hypothetical protein U0531_21915 [Dehalococcoidia bacterium]
MLVAAALRDDARVTRAVETARAYAAVDRGDRHTVVGGLGEPAGRSCCTAPPMPS